MLPGRHPACRRREAQPGSCTECENLAGDAKGKGASGDHREAESTAAPERGGLPRGRDEGSVMGLERRGQVIAVDLGPTGYAGRSPLVQRKAGVCLNGGKSGQMAFQPRADLQNQAIGWLRKGCRSLGGGTVARFPRFWMTYGECRLYSSNSERNSDWRKPSIKPDSLTIINNKY